jgi:hypothetical protein
MIFTILSIFGIFKQNLIKYISDNDNKKYNTKMSQQKNALKDTIKNIEIGDTLYMTSESNKYDSSAIVVKRKEDICGYVPRDLKEKIKLFVPSTVRVFDKRYIENGIYSLRVDIILPPHSNTEGSL